MDCSFNEIDSQCVKAARGAGLTWGLAQEAGWAVRWLVARDLDGAGSLARLLEEIDGQPLDSLSPDTAAKPWRAKGAALPGLLAGVAFNDLAGAIESGGALDMRDVSGPLLFLPFAAAASRVCNHPLEVRWGANQKLVSQGEIVGAVPLVESVPLADSLSVRIVEAAPVPADGKRRTASVVVDDAVLARLDALARRTYVPESDTSRKKGAGAGNIDND